MVTPHPGKRDPAQRPMQVSENSGRNIPGNARSDGVLPVNDEADVGKVESRGECAGGDDSLDLAVAGAVANAATR